MAYTSSQVVQAVPTGINSALVFIAGGTFTSAATNTITNCFSTTYTNYKILLWDIESASVGSILRARLGTSGSIFSGSTYNWAIDWTYNGANTGVGSDADNHFRMLYQIYLSGSAEIEILRPFEAGKTYIHSQTVSFPSYTNKANMSGFLDNSTSYTDFTLYATTDTSYKYAVYGYTKS